MTDDHEFEGRTFRRAAWEVAPASDEKPTAIAVTVDERGVVSDVTIPANWRDLVEPRDLGGALLDAANAAIAGRVAEQVDLFDVDGPPPAFAHREVPSANGDPTSAVAENLVNEVLDLFSRFDAELETYARQVRQAVTATNRGESSDSRVVVTVDAGQIASVDIDTAWASSARHTEIRAAALTAFRAAWTGEATPVALPPSIARLQELASDPQALSRQLGLSR
jgi:hypothetical protein